MKRSFERSPERRRVVLVGRPPPKPLRGFDSPGGGVIQSAILCRISQSGGVMQSAILCCISPSGGEIERAAPYLTPP